MNQTELWRYWIKKNYGSWRVWALMQVTYNWRLRKRLPTITKTAIAKGMIKE